MILTNCAACAAPLGLSLGKKCGRCSTRYCGPACQKQHWDAGGHNELCKRIKKSGGAELYHADKKLKEAVAEAVEACAEDTLDDLREAVTSLEETERTARRVLGSAHPHAVRTKRALEESQAKLRARETPSRRE